MLPTNNALADSVNVEWLTECSAVIDEIVVHAGEKYDIIVHYVIPGAWIIGAVLVLSIKSVLSNSIYTLLGVFAACLANCVPVGGGIIYIPVFSLLGKEMANGVVFTMSTMSCGNGIFGLLHWIKKDKSLFLTEVVPYIVFSTWFGYLSNLILTPTISTEFIRFIFGLFSLFVALFVSAGIYRGGITHIFTLTNNSSDNSLLSKYSLSIIVAASFLSGFVLLSTIVIGCGLITYITLSLLYVKPEAALVTGITTGGIVCWLPFFIHIVYYQDIPVIEWLMVLPGVYIGAYVAPKVSEYIGIINIYYVLCTVLLATSVLYLFF